MSGVYILQGYPRGSTVELRWPHGLCTRLRVKWSGFEPWPGTSCCVLGRGTLLLRCLSLNDSNFKARGNPAMY